MPIASVWRGRKGTGRSVAACPRRVIMSRAFVNENDAEAAADAWPDLPQSKHPNYGTQRGPRLLEERLAQAQERQRELAARPDDPAKDLELAHGAREIRYLEARIERAIVVSPAQAPTQEVAFGAEVDVSDAAGERHEFAIVGQDEADADHGKVYLGTPLPRAPIRAGVGDLVLR